MRSFSHTKIIMCLLVILGLGVPSMANIPRVYPVSWQFRTVLDPSLGVPAQVPVHSILAFENLPNQPIFLVSQHAYDGCVVYPKDEPLSREEFFKYELSRAGDYFFIADTFDCIDGVKLHVRAV